MNDCYFMGKFSSPFSGTFFNLCSCSLVCSWEQVCFRPLYRGLFSINQEDAEAMGYELFSSPLSGTFFNLSNARATLEEIIRFRPLYRGLFSIHSYVDEETAYDAIKFSSPLSGTFFNRCRIARFGWKAGIVFVPFIGDFFQSSNGKQCLLTLWQRFRPLSRGPFFNEPLCGK